MRDCILKLDEKHVLKRWMKWVARSRASTKTDQANEAFLVELINSPFNLITDLKIRQKIINILPGIPELTISEKILKSYLYLVIGNITRSDNILRQLMAAAPRVNWENSGGIGSLHHKVGVEQIEKIFSKFSHHPTDRRTFELFSLYIQNFFNDGSLLKIAENVNTDEVEGKLGLKYIQGLAPDFIDYLKLKDMSENLRFKNLRKFQRYPLEMQSYWVWPFLNIDPLVSEAMNPELQRIEKDDEMWFIYLMNNEKLADLFSSKKGRSFLPGRRPYLKKSLENPSSFMMGLYKLIELGDINSDIVLKTTEFLINE